MWLGPETLKLMICLWHEMFQERGEEGCGGRHELCSGFYVLICWTPEVVRKREAALGGIVKRRARFSTGTAAVQVFSESEKIGWEGQVPCDELDELSRPVMISKSYLLYDFICGAAKVQRTSGATRFPLPAKP
ncbi:hypothetical protein AVEN_129416-1 [Araneus ventricosus]|uniref:Uncharacterized protein n=1 Tax=Araneus ventricosus TaxID=182803 RepID=A0A4Y2SII5_ARAVE|nr:hypothetical protein AVEN_77963-1 [Araneus ventricosus]GBN87029.1 hypothetical protein AVEN_129416-1 [Araneus ventricosus]